jgi:hypothetical protein
MAAQAETALMTFPEPRTLEARWGGCHANSRQSSVARPANGRRDTFDAWAAFLLVNGVASLPYPFYLGKQLAPGLNRFGASDWKLLRRINFLELNVGEQCLSECSRVREIPTPKFCGKSHAARVWHGTRNLNDLVLLQSADVNVFARDAARE